MGFWNDICYWCKCCFCTQIKCAEKHRCLKCQYRHSKIECENYTDYIKPKPIKVKINARRVENLKQVITRNKNFV